MKEIDKYLLLDNLFNAFLESPFGPEDDNELVAEERISLDQIVHKNMQLFRQLNTQAKAELNKAKHQRVMEFIFSIKQGIASGIQDYKNIAEEILAIPRVAEMYRNLDEITENDKKSLLLDTKMLDILSDIEAEYRKKNME
jgi:Fe-S cluster assembly iron-binding protein IscA